MRLRPVLVLAYLLGITAIAVPIAMALSVADRQSMRELESKASVLASQALNRNQQITDQVYQAVRELEALRLSEPCSPAARQHMAAIQMNASRLQAVGYIAGNRLLCSSLGDHGLGLDVGEPEYTSPGGLVVRSERRLPFGNHSLYRISAGVHSGFAAIVHTANAFDRTEADAATGVGLIGLANMRPISRAGVWKPEWADRLGKASEVAFTDGEYVVALRRSARYAYFTYAAIPATRLHDAWLGLAVLLVPLGLLAGLLLALSVYLVTRQQLGLPAQLRNAVRRGELYLLYQPMVDLASGRWMGVEALLRWNRPDGESISPAVFVPVAERTGLIGRITREVIALVQRDLTELMRRHPDFFVSINFAADDLQDGAVMERLSQALRDMGIRPANLHVEATERTFMAGDQTRASLRQLRELGVTVVIDDFGTGYSSLAYLTQLDVNGLKIDKAFVDPIGTGAVTSHVIDHIIVMARSLGLQAVAEGVETEEQAGYLRERGVPLAQGWLFSRPLRPQDLEAELERRAADTAARD